MYSILHLIISKSIKIFLTNNRSPLILSNTPTSNRLRKFSKWRSQQKPQTTITHMAVRTRAAQDNRAILLKGSSSSRKNTFIKITHSLKTPIITKDPLRVWEINKISRRKIYSKLIRANLLLLSSRTCSNIDLRQLL